MVLDMLMPDMDGVETLLALRDFVPRLLVVAMSGGGRVSSHLYLRFAKLMGAAQVLEKPFSADQLLQAVASALAELPGEPKG
jgi:FixJ family two-component response regulator